MPQAPLQHVATLGIDIGKNSLHLIGMEACVGAHHLSRQLLALGHDVKLIPASGREPVLPSYREQPSASTSVTGSGRLAPAITPCGRPPYGIAVPKWRC
jgi:hypothetical protein